jgi:hypothetical protein
MRKIVALSTAALLALSLGLAQNTPATPATPQTPATTTGQIDRLGAQIQAMQQYISANKANLTKEQAQKLLPYFMAIRDTAAFTEGTADFYLRNIAGLLTPEQVAATNWPQATAQGATTEGAAAGNTNQNNAGAAGGNTDNAAGNNAGGNNAGGNTTDQNNNNAGAGGNTNDQNNAGAAGGNAAQGGNTTQTPATTAAPSTNPYSQAPYSDALSQIITTLMQIAYGTTSTQ